MKGTIMADQNEGAGKQTGSHWKNEEGYWKEQHNKQPYAGKGGSYEDYEAAYRVGVEGVHKYGDKEYAEVEESLATDYHHAKSGSALPWDTVRPAARAAWDRLAGVISPRDSDRGIRGSI
jgi:hypothetical protein